MLKVEQGDFIHLVYTNGALGPCGVPPTCTEANVTYARQTLVDTFDFSLVTGK